MLFAVVEREMATINPFDLLGDDTEDPSLLAAQQKIEPKKAVAPAAKQPAQNKVAAQPKLPSKPAPPAQAGQLSLLYLSLFIILVTLQLCMASLNYLYAYVNKYGVINKYCKK